MVQSIIAFFDKLNALVLAPFCILVLVGIIAYEYNRDPLPPLPPHECENDVDYPNKWDKACCYERMDRAECNSIECIQENTPLFSVCDIEG